MSAEPVSNASIKATVAPSGDITGVEHYSVQVVGQATKKCTATTQKLFCNIEGLSPVVEYTVQAAACLGESSAVNPCSTMTEGGRSWTKPSSKKK